jgi:monofunctional biosynthetic peptidoglycan transglycosylase
MSHDYPRIPPSIAPRDEPIEPLPPEAPEPEPPPRPRRGWLKRTLLWTLLMLALLLLTPPAVVLALRWAEPPTSAFMLQSEVQPVRYRWVPAAQIPDSMRAAVIAAEDQKFHTHWGFDFIAIAEALEHNEKSRKKRGASTISQQTAKNLFLWPSRSWLRKGLEVTFTLLLEGLWPKERILEVYLNIAEFGPGIYGVEAASQAFFDRPAAEMTPEQTARLAAVLPNPRKWRADRPGPYVQRRVDWILVHTGARQPAAEAPSEPPAEVPEPPADEMPAEEGATDSGAPAQPAPAPENPDAAPQDPAQPTPEVPAPGEAQGAEPAPAETTPAEMPAADPEPVPEAPAQAP